MDTRYFDDKEPVGDPDIESYVIEEDDDDDATLPVDCDGGGPHPFRLFLKILFSPRQGWKEVRRSRISPQQVLSGALHPLMALAAVARFAEMIFDPNVELSSVLVAAVVVFISFFLGYFLIQVFARMFLKGKASERIDSPFGKSFAAFSLATFVLFAVVYELLPMLEAVTVFLPLWTIYVICRGSGFISRGENDAYTSLILSVLVIGTPLLCGYLFSMILAF